MAWSDNERQHGSVREELAAAVKAMKLQIPCTQTVRPVSIRNARTL
jgi:hypothetical protein